MLIISIINFLVAGFLGYIAGRFGDYYLNFWLKDPAWVPHHWIFGLIMVIAGLFFFKDNLGLWIFSFGLGLFISDLKDFLNFKFIEPDRKTKENRKFWNID